jgi:signal transduction histidine kinase
MCARLLGGRTTVVRRTRIAIAGVSAIAIIAAALVLYVAWLRYTEAVRTTELERQVYAITAGLNAAGPLDIESPEPITGVSATLLEVEARLIGTYLVLTDAGGAVLYSSESDATLDRYDVARLTGAPDELGVRSGVEPLPRAGRVIIVAAPVDGVDADGYLVAVQPLRELAGARRGGALILLVVTLLTVVVAWVIGGIVAHRMTRPLVRLREGADAIAAGSWGHQVPVEGDEEVIALASAFNTMSARVDAAYTAQRHFVGDVSHEIRTPITSIQGFAGALLGDMAEDPEQRDRFARIIRQEAGRLMELTGTLLALADLDSGRVTVDRSVVDTTALAEALHSRHDLVAEERGVSFEVTDLGAEGRPLADELRLLQVASALVSNALLHAPRGGTVRVGGIVRDDRWCLTVDDSGAGVPAEERERIFERFVRLDASRASVRGGSGLGLSICRRLIDLMDGSIAVEDSDLGGARFIVCLERA